MDEDPAFAVPDTPIGLSVGAVDGGGSSKVTDAVMAVARRVREARARHESDVTLNVVFQIPGTLLRPDFEGVRLGTVFTRKRAMTAQVAVPDPLEPEAVAAFAFDALRKAIDLAAARIDRRKLGWDLGSLRATASDAEARNA